MEEKVKTSVAVVGAGCTGMMAAKILIEKGIDVVILEADSRVGGRLLTHKGSSGDYCDLGGQFMGPFDEKVFELCEELQIDIFHLSPIEHSLAYYSK
ncbi:amine oxidase [flavin-containing] B-like, partial [Saccoglossus kowalevskii]